MGTLITAAFCSPPPPEMGPHAQRQPACTHTDGLSRWGPPWEPLAWSFLLRDRTVRDVAGMDERLDPLLHGGFVFPVRLDAELGTACGSLVVGQTGLPF